MGERVTLEDTNSNIQGTQANPIYVLVTNRADGTAAVAVAPGAGATDVSLTAGWLASATVTASGAAATTFTDHGGTVIGVIPAAPTVGAVYNFKMPVVNGVQVAGGATRSAVTVSYS